MGSNLCTKRDQMVTAISCGISMCYVVEPPLFFEGSMTGRLAISAAEKGNFHVLKWMKKTRIPFPENFTTYGEASPEICYGSSNNNYPRSFSESGGR
jgi:hypothetical protein